MSAHFTVAICTRDRPDQLAITLDALDAKADAPLEIVVVDQSEPADSALAWRARQTPGLRVIADAGQGLSRARNIAWRAIDSEWVVFVDDDAVPDPDWSAELAVAITAHPEVDFVTGHVYDGSAYGRGDYLTVSAHPVHRESLWSGRWTRPWDIGLGVFMAVRRGAIERLGGWDERLGAGARFGGADDMDFNYRLLREGGRAYATPRVRLEHTQWRTQEELVPLYQRYMHAWSAFAMKHLKRGDVAGGLWLWLLGAEDTLRMSASALRRRSRLRARVALAKLRGLVVGTVQGLRAEW